MGLDVSQTSDSVTICGEQLHAALKKQENERSKQDKLWEQEQAPHSRCTLFNRPFLAMAFVFAAAGIVSSACILSGVLLLGSGLAGPAIAVGGIVAFMCWAFDAGAPISIERKDSGLFSCLGFDGHNKVTDLRCA